MEEALKGDDDEALKAAHDAMLAASHKMAEAMYKTAAPEEGEGAADPTGAHGEQAPGGDDPEVVDAEFDEDSSSPDATA